VCVCVCSVHYGLMLCLLHVSSICRVGTVAVVVLCYDWIGCRLDCDRR
jgi:hypothetical protein